jgi:hypothetical protein
MLGEAFEQRHGIFLDRDTCLLKTLATISAEQASRTISPTGATIAAHTDHIRYYLDVLEAMIKREKMGSVDWQASWQTKSVTPEAWQALRARLQVTYQRVLATMQGLEVWEGQHDIGASLAILAHTAYHLGAIRQALHLVRGSTAWVEELRLSRID